MTTERVVYGTQKVVTGLDRIRELSSLELYENPALEEIQFDSIETVEFLTIGYCLGAMPASEHLALSALSGLGGLSKVTRLTIEGNESLVSADLLDAIEANGDPDPVAFASIRFNPLLSEGNVHAQLDALGVQHREVCGNAEGNPECYCPVPD